MGFNLCFWHAIQDVGLLNSTLISNVEISQDLLDEGRHVAKSADESRSLLLSNQRVGYWLRVAKKVSSRGEICLFTI